VSEPTAPTEEPASPTSDSPVPLQRRRLVTAFLLTPLLAGFYPALMLAEPVVMPISMVLSYGSAFVFGIPLMLICHRCGVRQWWIYLLGGIGCSLPTVVLYALAPLPEYLMPFGLMPALAVVFWGASSGGVFWMIGVAGDTPVRLRTLFDPFEHKR
jgi:hypothetical protein